MNTNLVTTRAVTSLSSGRNEATRFFMCIDGEGYSGAEGTINVKGRQELKAAYRASREEAAGQDEMG